MSGRGRPLRFLAMVICGWIGLRVALLWPHGGSLPAAIRELVPGLARPAPAAAPAGAAHAVAIHAVREPGPRIVRSFDPARVQFALMGLLQYDAQGGAPGGATLFPATAFVPQRAAPAPFVRIAYRLPPPPGRWQASGWLAVRGGAQAAVAPGQGELGASQAGLHLAWLLAPRQHLALAGRLTAPLAGPGREAAVALEWQPGKAPIRLMAEHRFALDGGKGGFGAGAFGGVDGVALPAHFRLEAFGEAGVIGRARAEPYADGSARVAREVAQGNGAVLALGGGLWGGAQRGAQRLDLGPSAVAQLPVAGRNFRLALDWRQRVAGDARPGSGLALTLGAGF